MESKNLKNGIFRALGISMGISTFILLILRGTSKKTVPRLLSLGLIFLGLREAEDVR